MNRQELIDKLYEICRTKRCVECPLWHTETCKVSFEDMTDEQLTETHNVLCEKRAKLNTEESEKPINKPSDKNEGNEKSAELNDEMVKHPAHYNRGGAMECWDEMMLVFGKDALIQWCVMTAWKYRYRAGFKGAADEDMRKSDEYLRKAKELSGGK